METTSETRPEGSTSPASFEAPVLGRTTGHWCVLAFAVASWLVLAALGLYASPDASGVGTHEQFGLPACSTMEWFGVPCPGCGVTTSTALFAQGRFAESLRNQPFGFLCALLAALGPLAAFGAAALGRDLWVDLRRLASKRWLVALGVAVAVGWVWKLWLVLGA